MPRRFGVATTYYGISLNITGFGLNMFLTHFIYAAIEVPSKVTVYFLLYVVGRRTCLVGSLLLSGICIATNIFVPKGLASNSPEMTESSAAEAHDDLFYDVVSDHKDTKYFGDYLHNMVFDIWTSLSLPLIPFPLGLGCHSSCTDKVLV